jgi:Protein of unknown function (DUF3618)
MDQDIDPMATRPGSAAKMTEDDRALYDGNKPPHEIEEDIARTRVRLSATVEALEHELTPRRVIDSASEVLRQALEPPPGPFRDQVWAYGIPLALIVTGLGWLFALRRHSWQAHRGTPADAVETDEAPAPLHTNVVDPIEPLSLVNENSGI